MNSDRNIPEEWVTTAVEAVSYYRWIDSLDAADIARAVLAAVVPLVEAQYEWAQELTPAGDCPLDLHAHWFVAGEEVSACPGCEIDRLRNQLAEVEAATVNRCIEAVTDEWPKRTPFERPGIWVARDVLRSLLPATPAEQPTTGETRPSQETARDIERIADATGLPPALKVTYEIERPDATAKCGEHA